MSKAEEADRLRSLINDVDAVGSVVYILRPDGTAITHIHGVGDEILNIVGNIHMILAREGFDPLDLAIYSGKGAARGMTAPEKTKGARPS